MAEEIKIVASAVGFDQVNKALESTSKTLTQTSDAASQAGKTLGNQLKVGTAQATQSLTDLSRIVQDAPFGFIGIANNINPLVESFGRLKAESGSVGGALKSLLSGLSGPAGLGIAFSVVTTAITFAQIGFQAWSRGSKDAKESSNDFKSRLEELQKELKSVTDELNDFIKVADNASRLNDINITARFSDENTQGVLQRQSKFITISEELVKATDARSKAYENYLNIVRGAFNTDEDYNSALKAGLDVYNEAIKKENELIDARQLQAAVNRAATEEEKRAAAERIKNLDSIEKTLAKLKEDTRDQRSLAITFNTSTLQEQANLVKAAITKLITVFNVDPKNKIIIKLQADLADLNMQIRRENQIAPVTIPFKLDSKDVKLPKTIKIEKIELPSLEAIQTAADLANLFSGLPVGFFKPFDEGTFNEINKTVSGAFESFAEDAAIIFGETLGNALTGTASIGDFFSAIFASLGRNLVDLGKYLVKTAIKIELIKKTLFSNPALALIGGIALIAIGTAIANATNRNAFAVGTRYAPGGMALVGERGPEMINLPRGSQVIPAAQTSQMMGGIGGAIEVFGMLRGQDIFFSNRKYGKTYKRTT